MSNQTEKFIKGAVILSLAGLIAKVLSAVYRIPLSHMVGLDGIGYYDTVYPIYSILVAVSLVGVPNAVSKMVAEDLAHGQYKRAHKTFVDSMIVIVIIGSIVTAIMFFGSSVIIKLQNWGPEYRFVLYGLAISPVFISITGAIRGYFQGMQIMKPTAISQVIEAAGKVVIGLALVQLLLGKNLDLVMVVSGAAVGASMGFVLSTIYMLIVYYRHKPALNAQILLDTTPVEQQFYADIVRKILLLTIPVTIVSTVYSIMNEIDSAMLYGIFGNMGYSASYVRDIFGNKAMAFTVVNVPLTISLALAMSVVPAIAQANSLKDYVERNHKIEEAIKLALLFALPASMGIFVLARPLLFLLYSGIPIDPWFLRLYSICLVFMILGQTLAGILQGMTKQYMPLISLGLAIIVKIILNMVLAPYFIQGYGAPISSIIYYAIFVGLNMMMIIHYSKIHINWFQNAVKPFLAVIVMALAVYYSYQLVHSIIGSNAVSTVAGIFIGVISYAIALVLLRIMTREDVSAITKNKRLIKWLERYRLLRK
ncbi:MAG: polysaccharide biosynthesis protein [Vallitaleaceae bacterium]|jgi:stage V sporulation protein B|nr:polysaccharide biosynthesis protein [Vallitaleaceae bacterium]